MHASSSTTQKTLTETQRLEELWAGDFGDACTDRHIGVGKRRKKFWNEVFQEIPFRNVLEIGCNQGFNLEHLAPLVHPENIFGIDINRKALKLCQERLPDSNIIYGTVKEIPFRDRFFDLVISAGVLIHIPDESLLKVMNELARCSHRYVVLSEYYDVRNVEVPYRGQRNALFRRDYGGIFQEHFPVFQLRKKGFHTHDEEFDDETYWIFERV